MSLWEKFKDDDSFGIMTCDMKFDLVKTECHWLLKENCGYHSFLITRKTWTWMHAEGFYPTGRKYSFNIIMDKWELRSIVKYSLQVVNIWVNALKMMQISFCLKLEVDKDDQIPLYSPHFESCVWIQVFLKRSNAIFVFHKSISCCSSISLKVDLWFESLFPL